MLHAALHVLVSWSLVASAPQRSYEGDVAPTVASDASDASGEGDVAPTVATDASSEAEPAVVPAPAPGVIEEEAAAELVEPEGPLDDDDGEAGVAYDPLIDSPEAQRARSWVRSGAVFLGVGVVLTGGAIAMSQAPVNTGGDQEACMAGSDVAGNGCIEAARGRAVLAMAVPGALLLAGGIAMLVTGKVQQRRLRTSLRASRREVVFGLRLAF